MVSFPCELKDNRLHVVYKGVEIKVIDDKNYRIGPYNPHEITILPAGCVLEGAGIDLLFILINYIDFLLECCGQLNVNNGSTLCALYNIDNVANAYWNGRNLVCGNGDDEFHPFVSMDIVAHECTHGLVQSTCNLQYRGESGALNESFCDVFATAFEYYMYKKYNEDDDMDNDIHGQFDYFLGEDIMKKEAFIRNMADPHECKHPKIYKGEYWCSDPYKDNGGVHINSGVPNHLFYLISLEIGVIETLQLFYKVMKQLKSTSNFYDFSKAMVELCEFRFIDTIKKNLQYCNL